MFRNYIKIALRMLSKDKLTSLINIAGLAIGLASGIIILLFARHELSYDAFHKHADSVYLVFKERVTPTGTQITRDTWIPMAQALRDEFTDIRQSTRFWATRGWVQHDNKRFEEDVVYADPELLEMLTFPLAIGEASAFSRDLNSALISREIAQRYFGDADPIGEVITVDYETDYTVRGVLTDVPSNSSLQIDILLPFASLPWYREAQDNWGRSFLYTFIMLPEGISPAALESQLPGFVARIWSPELNQSMNLKLLPLTDLYDARTGARQYAYILIGVACMIVLIASINFMNLTTARSIERAREIGMRKVLGALRGQLVKQFLSEAMLGSLIALGLGLLLVELALPVFNDFYAMSLQTSYTQDVVILGAILFLTAGVGLVSGAYPAFVLSRFQPVRSLKGEVKTSRTSLHLRSALVVTQFAVAIVLMIGTGAMWRQVEYMKHANLNFDKENVIAIPLSQSDFSDHEIAQVRIETFENELRQHSGIESVSSSTHVPGMWPGAFTFVYPTDRGDSQRLRMRQAAIDAQYFETYGIEFISGRNFSEKFPTDAQESVILNQAALRDIGWPDAQDRQIRLGSEIHNVIGVVENYHYESLASQVEPVIHRYRPPDNAIHRLVSVKVGSGNLDDVIDYIRDKWQALDPTRAFEFVFVDDNFDRLYENENRLTGVIGAFAVLAIMLACSGLFALASLMISQRTKEIGVRKTLGASTSQIAFLLARSFVFLVAVAFLLAAPLAYLAASRWLEDFAYRTSVGWQVLLLAGMLSIAIAFVTVAYRSVRAALINPVEAIRYE